MKKFAGSCQENFHNSLSRLSLGQFNGYIYIFNLFFFTDEPAAKKAKVDNSVKVEVEVDSQNGDW